MTLAANGVRECFAEDAIDIAGVLLATGRAIPPDRWCDDKSSFSSSVDDLI